MYFYKYIYIFNNYVLVVPCHIVGVAVYHVLWSEMFLFVTYKDSVELNRTHLLVISNEIAACTNGNAAATNIASLLEDEPHCVERDVTNSIYQIFSFDSSIEGVTHLPRAEVYRKHDNDNVYNDNNDLIIISCASSVYALRMMKPQMYTKLFKSLVRDCFNVEDAKSGKYDIKNVDMLGATLKLNRSSLYKQLADELLRLNKDDGTIATELYLQSGASPLFIVRCLQQWSLHSYVLVFREKYSELVLKMKRKDVIDINNIYLSSWLGGFNGNNVDQDKLIHFLTSNLKRYSFPLAIDLLVKKEYYGECLLCRKDAISYPFD